MALQDDRKNSADGHSDWEQNLPEFLQESIQAMVSAWDKLDRGEEYYVPMKQAVFVGCSKRNAPQSIYEKEKRTI